MAFLGAGKDIPRSREGHSSEQGLAFPTMEKAFPWFGKALPATSNPRQSGLIVLNQMQAREAIIRRLMQRRLVGESHSVKPFGQ